jgi:hypothetical protein
MPLILYRGHDVSLNGHKPGCACPACRGAVAAGERRAAEAEQAATVRAVARLGAWMAAQLARSGRSAPDVLREALGPSDALRVLRMAGMDAGQVRGSWEAAEPVIRQASVQHGGGYSGDPDHDPRVTALLTRSGTTMTEINAVRRQVAEEYAGKAREAEARHREYYGLDQAPAAMGVSMGPDGRPHQRSTVHADVPPLGTGA